MNLETAVFSAIGGHRQEKPISIVEFVSFFARFGRPNALVSEFFAHPVRPPEPLITELPPHLGAVPPVTPACH